MLLPADADQDEGPEVKMKANLFDKVAGVVAIFVKHGMLVISVFRVTICSYPCPTAEFRNVLNIPDLVKILVDQLATRSQNGAWNAIKELAKHGLFAISLSRTHFVC